MGEKKQYAVFGLGGFGRSVALTLEQMGCDVIVVDQSYERIQEIAIRARRPAVSGTHGQP